MIDSNEFLVSTYRLAQKANACINGWLRKQGGPLRNFKLNWCVLRNGIFEYFNREDESRKLGAIPLKYNFIEESGNEPDNNGRFFFTIRAPPGQKISSNHDANCYVFAATSEADRKRWLLALKWWAYAPRGGASFGRPLHVVMSLDNLRGYYIPRVVQELTQFLSVCGATEVGIFRRNGSVKLIRDLRDSFERGDSPNLVDIHSAAGLLKAFFRELPEPVVPFEDFNFFCTCGQKVLLSDDPQIQMMLIKRRIEQLPHWNRNLLQHLCCFLNKLATHVEITKMGSSNFALVFATNILRDSDSDYDGANAEISYAQSEISVKSMDLLIREYDQLFSGIYHSNVAATNVEGKVADCSDNAQSFMSNLRRELAWSAEDLLDDTGENVQQEEHNVPPNAEFYEQQCRCLSQELQNLRQRYHQDKEEWQEVVQNMTLKLVQKDKELLQLREMVEKQQQSKISSDNYVLPAIVETLIDLSLNPVNGPNDSKSSSARLLAASKNNDLPSVTLRKRHAQHSDSLSVKQLSAAVPASPCLSTLEEWE